MNVFIICLVGWCLSQDLPLGWNINDAKDRKVLKQELEEGQGHQIMCRTVKCAFAKQRPFSKPFSGSDLNDAEDPVLKHSAKCKNTSCILIQLCSALQTPLSGKLQDWISIINVFQSSRRSVFLWPKAKPDEEKQEKYRKKLQRTNSTHQPVTDCKGPQSDT